MSYKTYHIPTDQFIEEVNISSIMGYEDGIMPEPFDTITEQMLQDAREVIEAKAEIKILSDAHFDDQLLLIDGKKFALERTVYRMMKKASGVAFFICTIGPALPEKVKELSAEGMMLESYVLDLIGSEAVDHVMDIVQEELREDMESLGLKMTNRYSPGYCDWNVAEQQLLFGILPGDYTQVALTPSSVMHPIKSISGIIGIGKDVKFNPYTCEICRQKDCVYAKRQSKLSV